MKILLNFQAFSTDTQVCPVSWTHLVVVVVVVEVVGWLWL